MHRLAHSLIVVTLLGTAACAVSSQRGNNVGAPKIAIAYNYVPEGPKPQARYGGENTLEVYVDAEIAASIRADFFNQALRTGNLHFIAAEGPTPAGAGRCPRELELGSQAKALGADFYLCVDRSFYYNDVSGAAVATTRIGVFSSKGDVLWQGDSTRGVGFRSLKSRKDIYLQTAKAAYSSNKEAAAVLNKALTSIN